MSTLTLSQDLTLSLSSSLICLNAIALLVFIMKQSLSKCSTIDSCKLSNKHQIMIKLSNLMLLLPILTVGQGNTEAGEVSCPSVSNVLCHRGPLLGRGLLPWSASPTSEPQRTTASGVAKVIVPSALHATHQTALKFVNYIHAQLIIVIPCCNLPTINRYHSIPNVE